MKISCWTALLVCLNIVPNELYAQLCLNAMPSSNESASNSRQICKADFNIDGKMDLAIPNADGTIGILLGDGNGGFLSTMYDTVSSFTSALCTEDFNNDGIPDLVAYDSGPAIGTVLIGDGTGHFSKSNTTFGSIFNPASSLCAADFNNDNKIDLAMSSGYNAVIIKLGNGNGTFSSPSSVSVSSSVYGELVSGDFNNDGKIDLATLTTVMLGDGAGSFISSFTFTAINHPRSLVVGDFNNDGKQDIATVNMGIGTSTGYEGSVTAYLGDGSGSFTTGIDYSLGDSVVPFQDRYQICAGDFDGDSKLDVAIGTWKSKVGSTSSELSVLIGNGMGGFAPSIEFNVPNYPHAILQHDVNNDGKSDIALLHRGTSDSSKVTMFTTCSPMGFADNIELENAVQLFPNPSQGECMIHSKTRIQEIKIMNQFGQVIHDIKMNDVDQTIEIHQQGLYWIKIRTMHETLLKKVMIE